jgi:ferredoxin--NADP+ reductase
MFQIVEARFLAPDVKLFRIQAPRVARKRQAGQFVILRVHEHGERILITTPTGPRAGTSSSRASARPRSS